MNNSYNIENEKGDFQKSWWQRRSKMEKKLTIFSVLALLVILTLAIVMIIFFTRKPETCLSSTCIQTSNEYLAHMNLDVDPCENFYDFACGSFMDNVQLDDEPYKTVETFMHETVADRVRGIIEEPEEDDDPRTIIMAKRLYRSCTNLSAIEEKGLRLIKDSLRQIGGFPLLEGYNWNERDFDWKTATYKLRELGYEFNIFIELRVVTDEREPSKRIIQINSPWNYLDEDELEAYYNLMVNISVVFGADRVQAVHELREVHDFMNSLFSKSEDEKENTGKYDPLTISELTFKFREIPWLEFINRLQFPAPKISPDQIVTVSDAPYFLKLQNFLRRTTKRVLANFIAISTIMVQSRYLTKDIDDLISKFDPDQVKPSRHRLCSYFVTSVFPLPVQAAYVEKYVPISTREHATKIYYAIKNQFRNVLDKLEWMDEETRNKAHEKLASTKSYIAFPNDLLDFDKINQRYLGYQMEEDNFLGSILNAKYYQTNDMFKRLHEPVEKDEELNNPYAMRGSPFYRARDNAIVVPSGVLHDVMFDEERPQYLNYGAFGSAVAHQILHTVFDSKSCKGNSKYYNWLSASTLVKLNEKISCIAMHYGKFLVPEIREYLNSSNTKNEDFADIAGLKIAYEAYNDWLNRNNIEEQLPGIDYTPKQLFWVAFAITHCGKSTPKAMEQDLAHSHESLGKYAVLGSLRNLEEFSTDFNCPSDSYMNVDRKCEIW